MMTLTTTEIMSATAYGISKLETDNARMLGINKELLAALKGLVERGTDSPEHIAAERAIANAEAAS